MTLHHRFLCSCGREKANRKELRVHIALNCERWPNERCTPEHHDPLDDVDQMHLRWAETVRRTRNAP